MKSVCAYMLLLVCSINGVVLAQSPVNSDFLFINQLTLSGKNREALFLLQAQELKDADTLHYLQGMNYYELRKLDSAALYLLAVQSGSSFYTRSRFFGALNQSYAKNYGAALLSLEAMPNDTAQKYEQLMRLERGGNYLLQRSYKRFDSVSAGFSYDDYRCVNEQRRLVELKKRTQALRKKSPALAGLLSAVAPGLGKFYVGKKGAGLAAFAASGALAAMTLESYYRSDRNWKSPTVITFGTLFTFFYVGNIFGSVFSVKQQIRSVNGKINHEILASIHVPLVRFFK